MRSPIRILHLDDNPLDAQLVALSLEIEQEILPTTLIYVQTKEEYLAALKRRDFDLILSDYRMPGYDGDQALAAARETCPEIPFIMVTGELGEELVIETLKRGATDYVLKDRIFRLVPAIKRALVEAENAKKAAEAEAARERLVEELGRRQAELLAVIQAMHGGVTVLDVKGNVVLFNEAQAKMLGLKDPSELKHNFSYFIDSYEFKGADGKLIPVEDWPVTRILRGETVVNCELSGRRKDTGREWFFSFSGQPVRDESGKQILSVLVARDITERRKAEEAIRTSESDLKHAQAAAHLGSWSWDLKNDLVTWSEELYHIFGVDPSTFVPSNAAANQMLHPDDRALHAQSAALALTGQEVAPFESRIVQPSGEERVVLASGFEVKFDASGKPATLFGTVLDITERKRAEEALGASEELARNRFQELDAIYKTAPVGLCLLDSNLRWVRINDKLAEINGIPAEAHIGRTPRELIPDFGEQAEAAMRRVLETGEPLLNIEFTGTTPSQPGVLRSFNEQWLPWKDEQGNIIGISVAAEETTERKRTEEALRESQTRLQRAHQETREILESIQDPFYAVDSAWRITYINGKALEVWGKTREEVLTKVVWDLYPEATRQSAFHILQEAMLKRQSVTFENWAPSVKRWVEVRAYPTEGGGLTISYPDISERKRAQERVEDLARFPSENPSPILRLSSGGVLLYANQASAPLLSAWKAVVGEEAPLALRELVSRLGTEHERQGIDVPAADRIYAFLSAPIPERGYLNLYGRDVTDRKRTEEALRESERRYSALFANKINGVAHCKIITDEQGQPVDYRIMQINEAYEQIIGIKKADIEGRKVTEVFPDIKTYAFDYIGVYGKIAREGGEIKFEEYFEATGQYLSIYAYSPLPGEFAAIFTDVTQQKQMEAALRESEELSHLALTVGQAGAWSWDLRTSALRWSDEYYRIFGIEPGGTEPNAEAGLSRIHPEDRQHVTALIEKTLISGEGIDDIHRVIWPDGSLHWVRGMARAFFSSTSGGSRPDRLVGLVIDVTAQKEAEARLSELNQDLQRRNLELNAERLKWQRLIEGIADEVWACDANGKVSVVNLATKSNNGLMDFEGKSLEETLREIDVLHPDGSVRPDEESPLRRSLRGDVLRGEELVRNRRTGTTRIRQYSSAPVADTEGRIVGAVAVIRDVTEERQAEAEIRRLNEELEARVQHRTAALERANKDLEAFSYSVSHDLKAPLRLISGFAALLSRQTEEASLTRKQQEFLGTIQEQAARMEELIRALLEFSRVSRKEPRLVAVDTRKMATEVITEQRQLSGDEARERVTVVEMGDLPTVRADPILLRMVFTNLLSNAFKFTRTVAEPKITIEARQEAGFFVFRVTDNGVGFSKGQTEKLFKVFQRLHAASEFEGSGIGLANVRKIVERHGGQVCGEGEEGKGATFYFTLPSSTPIENSQSSMGQYQLT